MALDVPMLLNVSRTPERARRLLRSIGVVLACVGFAAASSRGQETPRPQHVEIPAGTTSLEGVPTSGSIPLKEQQRATSLEQRRRPRLV
jgi:hypothetical protein